MGLLVDGVWHEQEPNTEQKDGRFVRDSSRFRHWVTADGSAGPTGAAGFKAEAGRYHLYVSTACPWSHRALILHRLKNLQPLIGLSVVNPLLGSQGWSFSPGRGVIADSINQAEYLHQIYSKASAEYSGRVTVPVLWDRQRATIVNNDSGDIMRMFNSAFDLVGANGRDHYPMELRDEIDSLNAKVHERINDGVYKAGFATTQDAYESAVLNLFEYLDELEQRLTDQRYLLGSRMTEADWRLFPSLIRFDAVYVGHFKCNVRRLADYPQLSHYARDLYQQSGIAETVDLEACKLHYYRSHARLNPTGIVPLGPSLDFTAAHDRTRFASAD